MSNPKFDLDSPTPPAFEVSDLKEKTRVAVAQHRFRKAAEKKEVKRQLEAEQRQMLNPVSLLKAEWERRFEQLTDEQAASMLELAHRCRLVFAAITQKSTLEDSIRIYETHKQFVAEHHHGGYAGLPDSEYLLAVFVKDGMTESDQVRAFGDAVYVQFGLFSSINSIIWKRFLDRLFSDLKSAPVVEGVSPYAGLIAELEDAVVEPWLKTLREYNPPPSKGSNVMTLAEQDALENVGRIRERESRGLEAWRLLNGAK